MRKFLATVSAIAVAAAMAGGIAYTANIALYSSSSACFDSSQTLACANQVITSINSGVTGNFAYVPGPVTNATAITTPNITLASAVVATGTLVAANQGLRARCAGTKQAALTAANVGLTIGQAMVVSLEGAVAANTAWDLSVEMHAATAPVTANYTFVGRGLAVVPTGSATNFMSVNAGVDTRVTDNNASFPLPVACVVYSVAGGIPTGSVTMANFSVEVLR